MKAIILMTIGYFNLLHYFRKINKLLRKKTSSTLKCSLGSINEIIVFSYYSSRYKYEQFSVSTKINTNMTTSKLLQFRLLPFKEKNHAKVGTTIYFYRSYYFVFLRVQWYNVTIARLLKKVETDVVISGKYFS